MRQLLDEDSPLADAARDLALWVGGVDQLETLDTNPLPASDFDWARVPENQRLLVSGILEEFEFARVQYFSPEAQTVLFRLLALAAVSPAEPLLRRTTPQRLAAALAWVMLAGNQQFSRRYGQTAKKLWSRFGVGTCADLGRSIARDLGMWATEMPGVTNAPANTVFLGDPGLLFSQVRRWLIDIGEEMADLFSCELESREASKPLVVAPDGGLEARALHVEIANAFVGDFVGEPEAGCQIVVGITYQNDELEMLTMSVGQAERLVKCVTDAIAASGLAS